jgi:hypothetical protein
MTMKTTKPRGWFDTAHCLHRPEEWSILVEREVRASYIFANKWRK